MKAYLVFADGEVLTGEAFGAVGKTVGQIVFNTLTGYQGILTDPANYGQIVTVTDPLMGNYGVNDEDNESDKANVRGFVVREVCDVPSNFRCEGTLDDFMKEKGVIGICGVDTRKITRKIRMGGVMNAAIVSGEFNKDELLEEIRTYRVSSAVESVTCDKPYTVESGSRSVYNVGIYDFGFKRSVLDALRERGCKVTVLPAGTPAKDALAMGFDGIMLPNGPGDPRENTDIIREIGEIAKSGTPIFAVSLGHQLLALSQGASLEVMPFGHRGGNQPVKDVTTGHTFMTVQNHGYTVTADSVERIAAKVCYININDNTVEGIKYENINALSLQFHPEAAHYGTSLFYDRFIDMMKKEDQ